MKAIQQPWIENGYRAFAHEGPTGVKIERLAKEVGKNKSSFYHLFADLEVFTVVLLDYHLEQSKIIAKKEANCKHLEDLITVIVEHKTDFLFNRQLRVNRQTRAFETCFLRVNEISMPAIIPIWSKIIELDNNTYLAELVFRLSLENFFLQITEETLNSEWLNAYFNSLQNLVKHFKKTGNLNSIDGGV